MRHRKRRPADDPRTTARTVILAAALLFIAILAALTIVAVVHGGVNVLTLVTLLVVALLGFGIGGALLGPPPGE